MINLPLVAGAAYGLGTALLAAAALPPAPPDLAAALARTVSRDTSDARSGWVARTSRAVLRRFPALSSLGVPVAELRVLRLPAESFVLMRMTAAAAGLLTPLLLWTCTVPLGLGVPLAPPALLSLALATAAWTLPRVAVARRAADVRRELRIAVSAYLDLVAMERAAGASMVEALEAAAAVGRGAFALILERLTLASRTGATPWSALDALADEMGVPELRDLADIASAAAGGAAVYNTLLAASRSLRHAISAEAHAAANAASERLVFPVALIGTGFLLLLFIPALARLLGSG
jgi:pilus assembly protein TadC